MKAMINGKEVELTETAVVFFEDLTWTEETDVGGFGITTKNHYPCRLEVKVTDEGLILDLWHKDECVATFGATAQELVDDLLH